MNLNKVMIAGRLTSDPEVRYTPRGQAVATFSIAINETWGSGDDKKETTTFVQIQAWSGQAEACGKYLKKASPVFIEGRLKLESWEKNGEKRSMMKVTADKVSFLGGREDDANEERESLPKTTPATPKTTAVKDMDNLDDIPFNHPQSHRL